MNQINFPAEIYAGASTVGVGSGLLKHDYRRQLTRWLRGATHPTKPWTSTNLSPSYSFHHSPFNSTNERENIESTEYANIIVDVISYYDQARTAGMSSLNHQQKRILKAWLSRALPAYWTHSGYMNWDTGMYLKRWHLTRYWAWGMQGLLAIASNKRFVSPKERSQAKYMYDRAFGLYTRLCSECAPDDFELGKNMFGVHSTFGDGLHFEPVRFQELAAEAVMRGLGDKPATIPPPLYAFDPAIGRLTITTPSYNTAILAVNNHAFPYGGIELARLFDAEQHVLSNIGGKAPAGMGVFVRRTDGTFVATSQRARRHAQPNRAPLIITHSPRGKITKGVHYPRHAYAGSFNSLTEKGGMKNNGFVFETTHSFYSDRINEHWLIQRRRSGKFVADVMFPTWGAGKVEAVLKTGATVDVNTQPKLVDVAYFVLSSSQGAYKVTFSSDVPADAYAYKTHPAPQNSNPKPDASLALRITGMSKTNWHRLSFGATITPLLQS